MIFNYPAYEAFIERARDFERKERNDPPPGNACQPSCPGWAVFETTRVPFEEIEKCDDCLYETGKPGRFTSDEEAEAYVLKKVFLDIECGNEDCLLCRKRMAGFCDCGDCEHCNKENL